jgi:transketolase
VIVANTTKGKGVDFMENRVEWHTLVPNADQLANALSQLQINDARLQSASAVESA